MSTVTSQYIDCPDCGRWIGDGTWYCPYCSADIGWRFEERRLTKILLRFFSVGMLMGVLLAVLVVAVEGVFSREIGSMLPLLAAFIGFSVAAWLWSDNFQDVSR